MFFTAVGILTCIAIGLALLWLTYYGYEVWRCHDGSGVGFFIRAVFPLIAAVAVLYLTFRHAPIQIVTG